MSVGRMLSKIVGADNYSVFVTNRLMLRNYLEDLKLFRKYSIVFHKKDFKNKEADLILNYHGLEKGMLFSDMKPGFAEFRIRKLHQILKDQEIIDHIAVSQVKVGYQVMCKYYELHEEKGFDIENIYNREQYEFYKSVLDQEYKKGFEGIYRWTYEDFYRDSNAAFDQFAFSRKSIRDFTGEKIGREIIENAVSLANSAPSVCNRQASNVYLVEDKNKIDALLKIQGGFNGYTEKVSQLLIVTNDRKYYYTIGERNQLFIDGGLYLMNLLYALHFYHIANCPANWGKTIDAEKTLNHVIQLPESEKIICMVPIGIAAKTFRTTLSERRTICENFKILK